MHNGKGRTMFQFVYTCIHIRTPRFHGSDCFWRRDCDINTEQPCFVWEGNFQNSTHWQSFSLRYPVSATLNRDTRIDSQYDVRHGTRCDAMHDKRTQECRIVSRVCTTKCHGKHRASRRASYRLSSRIVVCLVKCRVKYRESRPMGDARHSSRLSIRRRTPRRDIQYVALKRNCRVSYWVFESQTSEQKTATQDTFIVSYVASRTNRDT